MIKKKEKKKRKRKEKRKRAEIRNMKKKNKMKEKKKGKMNSTKGEGEVCHQSRQWRRSHWPLSSGPLCACFFANLQDDNIMFNMQYEAVCT